MEFLDLKYKISQNKTEEVLDYLISLLLENNFSEVNEVILIKARFVNHHNDSISGLVNKSEVLTQINNSILVVIDNLQNCDINLTNKKINSYKNNFIAVLEHRAKKIIEFYQKTSLKNIKNLNDFKKLHLSHILELEHNNLASAHELNREIQVTLHRLYVAYQLKYKNNKNVAPNELFY